MAALTLLNGYACRTSHGERQRQDQVAITGLLRSLSVLSNLLRQLSSSFHPPPTQRPKPLQIQSTAATMTTSTATPPSPSASALLRLPGEIRNKICQYALTSAAPLYHLEPYGGRQQHEFMDES
jgi:hypothetical protein